MSNRVRPMKEITQEHLDPSFKDVVADKIGLETIKPCYTCGSCTAICPVHEVVEDFDPRAIIRWILLGLRQEVLASDLIWLCCLCNSCFEVCPQKIKFSRVAVELRKMALDESYADEGFLKRLDKVRPFLDDLCRRTMFNKIKNGLSSPHVMPCWRKYTK